MARVPLLERAFGQDRLARQHRLVGFTSFNLMVAHVVLITWGYAAGRPRQVPGDVLEPDRQLPRHAARPGRHRRTGHGRGDQHQGGAEEAAVRVLAPDPPLRLPRRRPGAAAPAVDRHGLHLSPGRTVFWWTAWASPPAPCSCGAWACRCGRNLRHDLRVTSVVPEAAGVWSVYVTGRRLHRLRVESGQFLDLAVPRPAGLDPRQPVLAVRSPGRAQPAHHRRGRRGRQRRRGRPAPGDPGARRGPVRSAHRPRPHPATGSPYFGAGVGITPLRALAEGPRYALGRGRAVPALHRRAAVPTRARRARPRARPAGRRAPGRRRADGSWLGAGTDVGGVDDATVLRHWLPDLAERDVYVCGPPAWTDSLVDALLVAGLPADQLHLENFSW